MRREEDLLVLSGHCGGVELFLTSRCGSIHPMIVSIDVLASRCIAGCAQI